MENSEQNKKARVTAAIKKVITSCDPEKGAISNYQVLFCGAGWPNVFFSLSMITWKKTAMLTAWTLKNCTYRRIWSTRFRTERNCCSEKRESLTSEVKPADLPAVMHVSLNARQPFYFQNKEISAGTFVYSTLVN